MNVDVHDNWPILDVCQISFQSIITSLLTTGAIARRKVQQRAEDIVQLPQEKATAIETGRSEGGRFSFFFLIFLSLGFHIPKCACLSCSTDHSEPSIQIPD